MFLPKFNKVRLEIRFSNKEVKILHIITQEMTSVKGSGVTGYLLILACPAPARWSFKPLARYIIVFVITEYRPEEYYARR